MSKAYYRKWRPQTWDQIVGQDHIVTTLRNAVNADRVAHAYLFAGPRGTGKTSSARLLAKAVNCTAEERDQRPCNQCAHCDAVNQGRFLDLIEIDAASNTSVDDVRDLRDKINFSPNQGDFKVYIIDEVHMLSTAAFNALLKTLEEPPSHAIFILATTEIHKIPATVLSRCQRHEFRSIPVADIVAHLKEVSLIEDLVIDTDALTLVARQATGSLRDAVSLLDQLGSSSQTITLEMTQLLLGTATSEAVVKLVDALLLEDSAAGLNTIHQALDAGSNPRQFARQIVDYLRNLLLVSMGNADQVDTTSHMRTQMAQHAQALEVSELLKIVRAFNHAAADARNAWQPALPLEMAFVDSFHSSSVGIESAPKELDHPKIKKKPPLKGRAQKEPDPAPEPESPQSEPEVESLPQGVAKNWGQILKIVRDINPQTQALLNSCKPLGMKGNALVLGFNGEFAKSKMEAGENVDVFIQAMEQVLGKSMPVLCTVTKGGEMPPDIDQDGMVATALRDLGGKIVDVQ
jgi:DNA polymerase III subunit gamma/tau